MPKRIQRRRIKGWRMPEGAVYVGLPTKHGKPFGVECADCDPCHVDVLLELANGAHLA